MIRVARTAAMVAGLAAAGFAAMLPASAQAYDGIGPVRVGGVVAGAIIDAPAAVPYGGYYGPGYGNYGSERGYYGRSTRVHHGPFHDHAVVQVPRRVGGGRAARGHVVNYYYPAPAYYDRRFLAGW